MVIIIHMWLKYEHYSLACYIFSLYLYPSLPLLLCGCDCGFPFSLPYRFNFFLKKKIEMENYALASTVHTVTYWIHSGLIIFLLDFPLVKLLHFISFISISAFAILMKKFHTMYDVYPILQHLYYITGIHEHQEFQLQNALVVFSLFLFISQKMHKNQHSIWVIRLIAFTQQVFFFFLV